MKREILIWISIAALTVIIGFNASSINSLQNSAIELHKAVKVIFNYLGVK